MKWYCKFINFYKRKKENENTNCVDYNGHSNKKMYTKNLAFKDNTNTFL